MDPLAVSAALLAAAVWGLASTVYGRVLAGSAPVRLSAAGANLFKNVGALALFTVAALAVGDPWPAASAFPWLALSGLLGFALGDALYFAAIARAGAQTTAMVVLLNVPLAGVLSWLWLDEALGAQAVLGIAVVLGGVALVVSSRRRGAPRADGGRRASGLLLALAVAATAAVAIVLGHGQSVGGGVFAVAALRMAGGVLGAFPLALAAGIGRGRAGVARAFGELVAPFRDRRLRAPAMLLASACAIGGLVPYHLALRDLPGGVSAVLFATTPLFMLALLPLEGERVTARRLLGTTVGFAGVALIVAAGGG